jgi:hypothetical protein
MLDHWAMDVSTTLTTHDDEQLLHETADQCMAQVDHGRVGAALKLLDTLPDRLEAEKQFLRIQTLHRAGLHGLALQEIERMPLSGAVDVPALVRLASIATDAGAQPLAHQFLTRAAEAAETEHNLAMVLRESLRTPLPMLRDALAERLRTINTESPELLRYDIARASAVGRYGDASALAAKRSDFQSAGDLYSILSEEIERRNPPDYERAHHRIRELERQWSRWGHRELISPHGELADTRPSRTRREKRDFAPWLPEEDVVDVEAPDGDRVGIGRC